MKKILLSLKPYWFERIKKGKKKYEYRKRFCDEPVMAYLYVSRPVMAITGILILGKRILLDEWLEEYKENQKVLTRILKYSEKHKYALPITKFCSTNKLALKDIQGTIIGFKAPQMYYDLSNNVKLLQYIEDNIVTGDIEINNSFIDVDEDDICI